MSDKPDASTERCPWCGCSERYCQCPSKLVDAYGTLRAEVKEARASLQPVADFGGKLLAEARQERDDARAEVDQMMTSCNRLSAEADEQATRWTKLLHDAETERDHHRETLRAIYRRAEHPSEWLQEREPWLFDGGDDVR